MVVTKSTTAYAVPVSSVREQSGGSSRSTSAGAFSTAPDMRTILAGMRRGLGVLLLAVGLLLVLAAPVLRWWVAPALATAPTDESFESRAEGTAAVLFDVGSGRAVRNVPLTINREVTPDADASDGDTVVHETSQTLSGHGGQRIDALSTRLASAGNTSELVDCCEAVAGDDPVGEVNAIYPYKFPFDTDRRTDDYFDTTLRDAVPIEFVGEEELEGQTVYRFEHTIEPTQYSTIDVPGPGQLLGQPDAGVVTLPRFYVNNRTVWVEPETGVIVRGQEQQRQTLRGPQGEDLVTLLDQELTFTDENVAPAQRAQDGKDRLRLVELWIPLGALVVGLVLFVVGALMLRPRASRDQA